MIGGRSVFDLGWRRLRALALRAAYEQEGQNGSKGLSEGQGVSGPEYTLPLVEYLQRRRCLCALL